ncbi:hypothetical protein GYB22_00990 [bacterium]|nr:hypothetical protein [bacterium]
MNKVLKYIFITIGILFIGIYIFLVFFWYSRQSLMFEGNQSLIKRFGKPGYCIDSLKCKKTDFDDTILFFKPTLDTTCRAYIVWVFPEFHKIPKFDFADTINKETEFNYISYREDYLGQSFNYIRYLNSSFEYIDKNQFLKDTIYLTEGHPFEIESNGKLVYGGFLSGNYKSEIIKDLVNSRIVYTIRYY